MRRLSNIALILALAVSGNASRMPGRSPALSLAASSGGGGSTFASDVFTDTNGTLLTSHTMTLGGPWVLQTGSSGNGAISSNQAKDNAGNAPALYATADPTSADYNIQAEINGTGDCSGPAGRMSTSARTSYFVWYQNSVTQWKLSKLVAGTATTLSSYTVGGGENPTSATVTVKITITDAAKKLFLGGVERASSADNVITAAGKAGLQFEGITTDRADNFTAANP